MVPILIIGGVALWQTRAPRDLASGFTVKNPLDAGPARVEFVPFKEVALKPKDVYCGFDWAAQTTVKTRGKWDAPKGLVYDGVINEGNTRQLRLVYRRGSVWKAITAEQNSKSFSSLLSAATQEVTLRVNLEAVPKDAEEVRLRGSFEHLLAYRGTLPPGWNLPKGWRARRLYHTLPIESKPFDLEIKRVGEPMPVPKVSRVTEIELVDAKWFTEPSSRAYADQFLLHLRHLKKKDYENYVADVENIHVFDADNRELFMYANNGTGVRMNPESPARRNQKNFSPQKLPSDLIAPLFYNGVGPKGGWGKVKQPIRLEMEVSDWNCWPLKVNIKLRHQDVLDESKFGAPDAQFKPAG
jgi:hypothetical protein